MAQVDMKNATITIKSKSSADKIVVKIGDGNLSYTRKQNITYLKDRGKLDTARLGDEEPVEVSLDATWEYITGASATIEDALTNAGGASGWESTDPDTCAPYCVDLEIAVENPCTGDSAPSNPDETILLKSFRWENIAHDLKGGTFAITGKCNVTAPTATRS